MNLRVLAAAAGLLGGACWIAVWAGGGATWSDAVHWVGLGLLGLALAGVGAGLVSKGALWLRAIVAVAFPLLVWSVYAVLRGDGDGRALGGVIGVLAVLAAVAAVAAGHRRKKAHDAPARAGSHAA